MSLPIRAWAVSVASEAVTSATGASVVAGTEAASTNATFLARGLDTLTALASSAAKAAACVVASSFASVADCDAGVVEDFSVDLDVLTMLAIILYYYTLLLSNLQINILYYIFIIRSHSIVSCKIK